MLPRIHVADSQCVTLPSVPSLGRIPELAEATRSFNQLSSLRIAHDCNLQSGQVFVCKLKILPAIHEPIEFDEVEQVFGCQLVFRIDNRVPQQLYYRVVQKETPSSGGALCPAVLAPFVTPRSEFRIPGTPNSGDTILNF